MAPPSVPTLVALASAIVSAARASEPASAGVGLAQNPTTCGVGNASDGEVKYLTDGTYNRCFSVITPMHAEHPMPVLFWFHGSHGNARDCAANPMAEVARAHGFALVCGESLQMQKPYGVGHWTIPEVQTDDTGTRCTERDSLDVPYIEGVVKALDGAGGIYDTARLFFSGCSMGSAMSIYIGNCMKAKMPESVSAFATHSTGLKVKGDGLGWPRDIYNPQYITGECPECQYFPFAPTAAFHDSLGLKACIFDNTEDPNKEKPSFYLSSVALGKEWSRLGMRQETHFRSGGHCRNIPYDAIAACLDDGSGRLLRGSGPDSLLLV